MVVEDTLTVRLALDLDNLPRELIHAQEKLLLFEKISSKHIEEIRSTKGRWDFIKDPLTETFLGILKSRLKFVKEKLGRSLDGLPPNPHQDVDPRNVGHRRSKRGLFNFMGVVGKTLFGTATDDDVVKLSQRTDDMGKRLEAIGRLVEAEYTNGARLTKGVNEMVTQFNTMTEALNNSSLNSSLFHRTVLFLSQLDLLETTIDRVILAREDVIRDIYLAAESKVGTHMLSPPTLEQVLVDTQARLHLNPIFPPNLVAFYYPLLESSLSLNCILVHIPMKSNLEFSLWTVHPFPFFSNKSMLTLDVEESLAIISHDRRWIDSLPSDTLQKCKHSELSSFICPAYLFTLRDVDEEPCLFSLISTNVTSEDCNLTRHNPQHIYHVHIQNLQFFFFPQEFAVSILCENQESRRLVITGPLVVNDHCEVRSHRIHILPNKHHLVHSSNLLSETHQVPSFSMPNTSRLAVPPLMLDSLHLIPRVNLTPLVDQNLPFYLSREIQFPTYILLYATCIAVIIVLGKLMLEYRRRQAALTTTVPLSPIVTTPIVTTPST